MTERDAALDDLLIRWWNWKSPIQPARGYQRTALGFESFRITRQYDDQNGALYDDEEAQIMKAVEREINALESIHRMVTYTLARALTLGISVLLSPRIEDKTKAVSDTRAELTIRLVRAGVM